MRVAINISGAINITDTRQDNFTAEIINRVINNHPDHEFILVSDIELTGRNELPKNCIQVYAGSKGKNPITWKWWYDVRIPSVLKKHKADLLVNCDGCSSLQSRIPQLIVVSNLSFISFPGFFKKSRVRFLKRNTAKFLKKSEFESQRST